MILEKLGVSLKAYLEPPIARLAVALALRAEMNLEAAGRRLAVVLYSPMRSLEEAIRDAMPGAPAAPCGEAVEAESYILLWCPDPEAAPRAVLAVGTPELKPTRLGLVKVHARRLGGDRYQLTARIGGRVVKENIRLEGYIPVPDETTLDSIAEAALRILNEYGPLELRDLVSALAGELGITRGEARREVMRLIAEGVLRKEGSMVLPNTG